MGEAVSGTGVIWNPSRGESPSESVLKLADAKPRKVIDLGCGDGRNLLPFLSSADLVVGIDVDHSSLLAARARLDSQVRADVVLIEARLPDVVLAEQFNLIIGHGVLHFLTTLERGKLISLIRAISAPESVVSIVAFNARQPIPEDLRPLIPEPPPDSEELLSAFKDWQILSWETYDYEDSHNKGKIRHRHSIDRLQVIRP